MSTDEYPSDKDVARTKNVEEKARDAVQIVNTRYLIRFIAVLFPLAVLFFGWLGNRAVGSMDHIADQQATMTTKVASIEERLNAIVTSQVVANRTISERVEEGLRTQDSRANAQTAWIQRLSDKIEDLFKRVYQIPMTR